MRRSTAGCAVATESKRFLVHAVAALALALGPVQGGVRAGCLDVDGDGVCDADDNCPAVANPNQGSVIDLTGPMVGGGDGRWWRLSPDDSFVVYTADQDTDEVVEIYAAPMTGAGPIKLNPPLTAGGNVDPFSFVVSPDGTRVVYAADQDTDETVELYSVPIAGGPAVKLNPALAADGDVRIPPPRLEEYPFCPLARRFPVSPATSRIVYRADQDTDDVYELYSVLIGGGGLVALNGPMVSGGDVTDDVEPGVELSPDGMTVVYRADQDEDNVFELYSVPVDGGVAPARLNPLPVAGGDVYTFAISATGIVVFTGDLEVDERFDAYTVPITGGAVTNLTASLASGSADVTARPTIVENAPGGPSVIIGFNDTLYSIPLAGDAPLAISEPDPSVDPAHVRVTPDGTHAIYVLRDAYSASLADGTRVLLATGVHPPQGGYSSPGDPVSTGDSSAAILWHPIQYNIPPELISVPIVGGPPTLLANPFDVDTYLSGVCWGIVGDQALFVGHAQGFPGSGADRRVFRTPVTGGMPVMFPPAAEEHYTRFPTDPIPVTGAGTLVYGARTDGFGRLYAVSIAVDEAGQDRDGDGWGGACDCDDRDPDIHASQDEINDGQDQSCPGDYGGGLIDEIGPSVRFQSRDDMCWDPQEGATLYSVGRTDDVTFCNSVKITNESGSCTDVSVGPAPPGLVRFYLVRPSAPHLGSWGPNSSGDERGCGSAV